MTNNAIKPAEAEALRKNKAAKARMTYPETLNMPGFSGLRPRGILFSATMHCEI